MKKDYLSFPKQILISLVLTSIFIGFEVKPVQAQFTVFDPSQYVLQLSKKIEEATRWMETINHYISMYENAVKQYEKMVESVSNLRGILNIVDEQIMRHKQLITTYSQLGKLIRGVYELKKRVENTITSQIQAIVNISRRYRSGIFDMDQNKRDLDDFLRFSIGRSADAQTANLERLAKLDSELEKMLYDREMILLDLAKMHEEEEQLAERLRTGDYKSDADNDGVQSLISQMQVIDSQIKLVEGQLRELEAKIQEKFVKYGLKIERMTEFGKEIRKANQMMTTITTARENFENELEKYDVWRIAVYDNQLP
jgi:chromosome segregation ATPase